MTDQRIDCPRCGEAVPDATFCIRCGASLRDGGRGVGGRSGSYAAAPGEAVDRVALFSTLMPQLPVADLDAFRFAFGGGVVALLFLVAIGAFPVALVGAAVLVPALVVLYVYSVDVYEDTPLPVLALTLVWGDRLGRHLRARHRRRSSTTGGRLGGTRVSEIVTLGVIVPLLGLAAMVSGPLVLLRDRRYNDVVDGATFGVASAVAFVGAQVIAGSIDLFAAGLTPVGEPLPWVGPDPRHRGRAARWSPPGPSGRRSGPSRSAIGHRSATAAPWASRAARSWRSSWLGPCWSPPPWRPTCPARSSTSRSSSRSPPSRSLAARTLHVGLLEEAFEIEIGDEITCANCGKPTRAAHVLRQVWDRPPRPPEAHATSRRP